jgi:transposase
MWTDEQRKAHEPRSGRYPSDVTDEEWAIIGPMIPPARTGGRKRETNMREVFNAIRYVDRTGCQWRLLPKDFPPHTTVYNYFWEWTRYGVLDRIHQTLLQRCREACGREGDPTAAIIDTQVAKATEKGGFPLIQSAMMRARKLKALSATPSSTPKVTSSRSR